MKINISKISVTPNNISEHCAVYNVTSEIEEWVSANGLTAVKHPKGYLNIHIDALEYRYEDLFTVDEPFYYFDGFSPNLNKELHLGHLSNLVYASAIANLCGYLNPVSILNDTDNHKNKEKFYDQYKETCKIFNYKTYRDFFSSEMDIVKELYEEADFEDRKYSKYIFNIFKIMSGKFEGCTAIDTKQGYKTLLKSDGSTTYLNQDLSFAKKLHEPILYLTGVEQESHFEVVTDIFKSNKHLKIGLITTDKEKMSSRKGNVVLLKDVIKEYPINVLKDTFLNYNYGTFKDNVEIKEVLSNKFTGGATMFDNKKLYLTYLTAKNNINPSLLFNKLKKESNNDIDFGLKLLGYTN